MAFFQNINTGLNNAWAELFPDLFTTPTEQYMNDPYRQNLAQKNQLMDKYMGQFRQDRLAEAEEAAGRAANALQNQMNMSGFTGTSTATNALTQSTSDIMGQAGRDINQLASQIEAQKQGNVFAGNMIEQGLRDRQRNQALGLIGDIAGMGMNMIPFGNLFSGMTGDVSRAGGTPYDRAINYVSSQGIPWHRIFGQENQPPMPGTDYPFMP